MLNRLFICCLAMMAIIPTLAQETAIEANLTDECVANYDDTVDYFPDKIEVEYAQNFSVEYFNHYKVVTMTPFGGADPLTYVLVQCGTDAPQDIAADAVVTVPVERIVTLGTTMLPPLDSQDLLTHLVGVDSLAYTNNEQVLEMSESLVEVGGGFVDFNLEALIALEPDVIMGQTYFAGDTAFDPLTAADFTVVFNGDFGDTSPLGAAEWGKYMSLFFNTEALATEQFQTVAEEYNFLVELAAEAEDNPTVIAASPYDGTWYMPAADSTIAQLIADAGGNFLFSDLDGTSAPLSIEEVIDQGADADYWVNLNQIWLTSEEMLAADERYADFAAFEAGNIWNNNLQQSETGGNAYFESGFANPHLILGDLVAILHPDLLPEHEFSYYRPLETTD